MIDLDIVRAINDYLNDNKVITVLLMAVDLEGFMTFEAELEGLLHRYSMIRLGAVDRSKYSVVDIYTDYVELWHGIWKDRVSLSDPMMLDKVLNNFK